MNKPPLICLGLAVALLLPGCSSGSSNDGIPAEQKQQLSDINSVAKQVNGDYDKLNATQKQQVLQMANGNEQAARQLFKFMAHPPNEHVPQVKG